MYRTGKWINKSIKTIIRNCGRFRSTKCLNFVSFVAIACILPVEWPMASIAQQVYFCCFHWLTISATTISIFILDELKVGFMKFCVAQCIYIDVFNHKIFIQVMFRALNQLGGFIHPKCSCVTNI